MFLNTQTLQIIGVGERLVNQRLAKTLVVISEEGSEVLSEGPMVNDIIQEITNEGYQLFLLINIGAYYASCQLFRRNLGHN